MTAEFFNAEKCQQRNRIVAQREDVEGAPIQFRAQLAPDFTVTETAGQLYESEAEVMQAINALLPDGASALTASNVYVHYLEAASNNFINDRYALLGESTLRNIAADAATGVAFMNSHRTGTLSTPSELPFGKTFAGQYQSGTDSKGQPRKRAMVGFYMLRGVKPNGENGPTTDDLDAMIRGGQVADISVGLSPGESVCNVCGSPLAECNHVPGTRRAMTDAQVEAQTAAGIPGGRASYTIENRRLGEVSGVFNGAVPGAGVKKVMKFRRKLGSADWRDARQAFGALLDKGAAAMDDENLFDQVTEAVREGVSAAFAAQTANTPTASEDESMTAAKQAPVPDPALAELQTQLAAQRAEFEALRAEKESAEKLAAQSAERIQRLEAEALRKRFADEVFGTGGKQPRWVGDNEAQITHLCALAGAFGEDSAQVNFYVQEQRAHAALVAESAAFKSLGSEREGLADGSALSELNALASKRAAEKKMSFAVAFDQICQETPALYDRYVKEGK